jgi:hypothetical protein
VDCDQVDAAEEPARDTMLNLGNNVCLILLRYNPEPLIVVFIVYGGYGSPTVQVYYSEYKTCTVDKL